MPPSFVSAALGATLAHGTVTAASLTASMFRSTAVTPSRHILTETDKMKHHADSRASAIQQTLRSMYAEGVPDRRGFAVDAAAVTFDDPAASCRGVDEIAEAFRALQALDPIPLQEPELVYLSTAKREFVFRQTMEYTIGGKVVLDSLVVVEDDGEGRVVRMKELWNGVPLLPGSFVSRRLNGLVSYALTSRML